MSGPAKGKADYYAPGDHNGICYECGRKFKFSELVRHWQGYYVCPQHWEPRHPQDFVQGVADTITPPWVQPPSSTFAAVCAPDDQTAIPGLAIPACVKPAHIAAANSLNLPPN